MTGQECTTGQNADADCFTATPPGPDDFAFGWAVQEFNLARVRSEESRRPIQIEPAGYLLGQAFQS